MDSIEKKKVYLNIARELARLSHCMSFKVGAIIVKDGRILSTGINGTPKGSMNCDEVFSRETFERERHHEFSLGHEIHAEMNAIIFAARNGISIEGADMYITMHPCNDCLKMLCNSGLKNIYFSEYYDKYEKSEYTEDLLKASGLNIVKID